MKKRSATGFSLVELLIAIAIFVMLGALSVQSFANFSRSKGLATSASVLASALRDARSRTLASVGGSQYGVKVDTDRFTLFKGATFSSSTPENQTTMLLGGVMASTSMPIVVFDRVTGLSSASGTIDLYLPRAFGGAVKTVSIERTGIVNIQ